jgi:hypothetical protein
MRVLIDSTGYLPMATHLSPKRWQISVPALVWRAAKYSLMCFLCLRLLTSGILLLAAMILPPQLQSSDPGAVTYQSELQTHGALSRLFLAPWYRWDTVHYLEIADHGYLYRKINTVWPPLYPLLTRGLSVFISPSLLSAILVSNFAALASFFMFYLLVVDIWGESIARKALLWMAVFPTAFFLVAAYSESLFMALSLGCLYAFRKSKTGWRATNWCALLGALAFLTRLQGIVLLLPIAWEVFAAFWVKKERTWRTLLRGLVPGAAIALTAFAYLAYLRLVLKVDFPWRTLSVGWTQHFGAPWEGVLGNLKAILDFFLHPSFFPSAQIADLFLVCAALALCVLAWKQMPLSYALYTLAMLLLILVKVDNTHLLVSASRYLLTIFPLFVMMTIRLKKMGGVMWLGVSVGGQVILLLMFYWWMWVA